MKTKKELKVISSYDKLQMSKAKKVINDSKIIAYDLDQIVIRSEIPVVEQFNKDFKTNYKWQDHGWDTMNDWLRKLGIKSDKEISEIAARYWMNPKVLIKAPVDSSTLEFIEKMHSLGKRQLIITSRKPIFLQSTMEWLEKNNILKFIRTKDVFMNLDKSIKGIDFKKKTIEKYADLMVEDSNFQMMEILKYLDSKSVSKKHIIWIPAGVDKRLKKPKDKRIIKFKDIKYLSLVAQSY